MWTDAEEVALLEAEVPELLATYRGLENCSEVRHIMRADIASYAVIFAIGTLVSTWLLAFAYKNTKHLLKHKVAVKRESAVTKEMNKKLADDKKISKKEKDERILWKKNEVCSRWNI